MVLSLRAGFRVIEIEKGKSGILVGSMDKMDAVITTIIDAVNAGELDQHLASAGRVAKATSASVSRRSLTLPNTVAIHSGQ